MEDAAGRDGAGCQGGEAALAQSGLTGGSAHGRNANRMKNPVKQKPGESKLRLSDSRSGANSWSTKHRKFFIVLWLIATLLVTSASAQENKRSRQEPLRIQEQGSFAVGGTVINNPGKFDPYRPTPDGQTLHGDHAYVFYQLPVKARQLPLVMWHGFGQFSKTWETIPDGREGYQNIFLRRRFGVYVIDQPRRGDAGRSTLPMAITSTPDEQLWFGTFRLGIWPDFFPGVQFSQGPEALNQYFRSMTPNTGPLDGDVMIRAVASLFDKIGPGILVTHSHSGGFGWQTAMKNQNVRAIVS